MKKFTLFLIVFWLWILLSILLQNHVVIVFNAPSIVITITYVTIELVFQNDLWG